MQLIVMMGIVSLFGDITYEGARSISGPYLAVLGASAGMVGLVAGTGEFLGYALRLVSGYLADRSRAYWTLTFLGYGLICAIPLLALAGHWQSAALLLVAERMGKGIRTPARDTILSHATIQVGRGMGFGIHEALDQTGAVLGPLVFAAAFALQGSYRQGFAWMWAPALLCLAVLFCARQKVPAPAALEKDQAPAADAQHSRLPRIFWTYSLFTFLSVAGFASFQIMAYHFKVRAVLSAAQIPVLYAVAMGVDAVVALITGRLYDRSGMKMLATVPLLTAPIPFLAFGSNIPAAVCSVILWGAVMGIHETVMRAALADLTPLSHRGRAYGIFNSIYGAGWFLGSTLMGLLYDQSITLLIIFAVACEAAAIPSLAALVRRKKFNGGINRKH